MNSTSTAALAYVNRGWMPVPLYGINPDPRDMNAVLCQCGSGDPEHTRRQGGKHPIYGAWQQRDWRGWDGWPRHRGNVGIATGTPSGFWVLDCDPASFDGGDDGGLLRKLGPAHVRTGGNGLHWRFVMPDFEVTNRRGKLPPGWDVRGNGGQVVAPPSVSGKGPYLELRPGVDVAPGWLLDLIRPESPLGATEVPALRDAGLAGSDLPSIHPAGSDREQRYALAALQQICQEYAALSDGRRSEPAWHLACRAVELMNLGRLQPESARAYVLNAIEYARRNGPPGGLTDAEALRLWERARAEIGERRAEITAPDPTAAAPTGEGFALPFSLAPQDGATTASEPAIAMDAVTDSTPVPLSVGGGMPPMTDAGSTATGVAPTSRADADVLGGPTAADPFENAVRIEQWKINVRDEARRRIESARAAARPPLELELIEADKLDTVAGLMPLVPDLLFADSLARINGRPGQGKSFIVADLACSVAAGGTWAGRPVRAGPVVAVVAEGVSGFKGRIRAWEHEHDRVLGPAEFALFPRAPLVGGPEWPAFVALCVARGAALITLDTQARATVGLKENDASDMGMFVAGLEELRAATGACVLVVHHAAKSGDEGRGSNAVEGAMASEFSVTRAGVTVTLRTTKQKDIEEAAPQIFDLRPVQLSRDLGDGMSEPAVPSAVLIWRDPAAVPLDAGPVDVGKARQRALWTVMHESYGTDGGTRAEVRTALRAHPLVKELKSDAYAHAYRSAWNGLIRLGLIAKRGERFRVLELTNQSEDGVLTVNPDMSDGGTGQLGPSWTLWTSDDEKSNGK